MEQRVNKFRVWDNHYKKWLTAEAMELNVKLNPVGGGAFTVLPLDKFIDISQFTGLTDKNGKEICEGDVVECYGMAQSITIDGFHGYRFMFGLDTLTRENGVNGKVIGNIYENPELLKP